MPERRRPGPEETYRIDRFRIGWYDNANNLETPSILAEAGFDSVMPYTSRFSIEEVREFLKAAESAGIGVHLDIPRFRASDRTGVPLEEYVRATRDSSTLLSWYLFDEPEWKLHASPRSLENSYAILKSLDPDRDVSMVFILPALAGPYRAAMDRMWIDYYPLARGRREFDAFRGGRYADRMKAFGRRADRYGLPLTIVPQGYGEKQGEYQFGRRLPTKAEAEYMFWASFLARPEEIVYWTLYRTTESWFRDILSPLVREFREKFPESVEYRSAAAFRISGADVDAIRMGDGRGTEWLLVLSRESDERPLEIEAPGGISILDGVQGPVQRTRRPINPYGVELIQLDAQRLSHPIPQP